MSYSGDPGAKPTDHVRHLIGDTSDSPSQEFLTDTEIDWEIEQVNGSVPAAAANCADRIAARLFPRVDYRMHNVWISGSQLRLNLKELATQLRDQAALAGASPFLSGVSKAQRDAAAADTDLRQTAFSVGMHDIGAPDPTRQ